MHEWLRRGLSGGYTPAVRGAGGMPSSERSIGKGRTHAVFIANGVCIKQILSVACNGSHQLEFYAELYTGGLATTVWGLPPEP